MRAVPASVHGVLVVDPGKGVSSEFLLSFSSEGHYLGGIVQHSNIKENNSLPQLSLWSKLLPLPYPRLVCSDITGHLSIVAFSGQLRITLLSRQHIFIIGAPGERKCYALRDWRGDRAHLGGTQNALMFSRHMVFSFDCLKMLSQHCLW